MDISSGLILAFAYVAAPGPITIETLRQGVKGGIVNSLAVQTGSLIGLAVYALLALLGADLLLGDIIWQLMAGVAGTILLFCLGITTIRSGHHQPVVQLPEHLPIKGSGRRAFITGAALSLANPLDIVFWLSISSRKLGDPALGGAAFWAGFCAGCLLTSFGVALIACLWRARYTPKAAQYVSWICGVALIGFGLRLGLSIWRQLAAW